MGVRLLQWIAGIAAVLVVAAPLTGCAGREAADGTSVTSASGSPSATGPAEPAPTQRTGKWTTLKAGDCLTDAPPTDPLVVTVTLVDCTQPHLAESYLRADIPVNEALSDIAGPRCDAGFTAYTGRPVARSPVADT